MLAGEPALLQGALIIGDTLITDIQNDFQINNGLLVCPPRLAS